MKIVFLHFHLNTGGVTTVIRQQIRAMGADIDPLVISGEAPADAFPAAVAVVPSLAYDTVRSDDATPEQTAEAVEQAIAKQWPDGCDLIHVHNPTLAKNRDLLAVIGLLQQRGHRFLLQIHDFAEDGRPDVYFDTDYPGDCHYAVINRRDVTALQAAGLQSEGLHLIPNMVDALPESASEGESSEYLLYPVRAIRRKNIGEAILLSRFLPPGMRLWITRPPNSPADVESYRDWKRLVNRHGLRVDFEVGVETSFQKLVTNAHAMITTSINEGFGFAFVEPWTAGKHLCGRKIAGIVDDFEARGIDLSSMYSTLRIPIDWLDLEQFEADWAVTVKTCANRFGIEISDSHIEEAFSVLATDGTIDYGLLHETQQKEVLHFLETYADAADELIRVNPFLVDVPGVPPPDRIDQNRDIILREYSADAYRRRLLSAYNAVCSRTVSQRVDRAALLAFFFDLSRFSLLKWKSYDS